MRSGTAPRLSPMVHASHVGPFIGRAEELKKLLEAIRKRESLLVWGPPDSGKTTLLAKVTEDLTDSERLSCISWSGSASRKQVLSHFVGRLFETGNHVVRSKVGASAALSQWLRKQTSLRLRGILFTALKEGRYYFFLDHFSPSATGIYLLMKEIMYRCQTPIYLTVRDYSRKEIGNAWSLYWTDRLRLHLGPLRDSNARELLELCIRNLRLDSLNLADFREEILQLSGHLPGSIVKMCTLAANSKYHYGARVKTKLVHIDYLMRASSSSAGLRPSLIQ